MYSFFKQVFCKQYLTLRVILLGMVSFLIKMSSQLFMNLSLTDVKWILHWSRTSTRTRAMKTDKHGRRREKEVSIFF